VIDILIRFPGYLCFREKNIRQTAKLFPTGRSQAVRLPGEFRFEGKEVFIRRDPKTGDVVLSQKPDNWDNLWLLGI
jgi:antitoxin VapB